MLKKVFIISISLAVLIWCLNINKDFSNYSFLTNLKKCFNNTSFSSPIDSTKNILNEIQNLNVSYLPITGGSLWNAIYNISSNIVNFFKILLTYIQIPFVILKDVCYDIYQIFNLVLRLIFI